MKKGKFIILFFLFCLLVGIIYNVYTYAFDAKNKPLVSSSLNAFNIISDVLHIKTISLASVVQEQLADSTGSYSVVIKNLKTGESYNFQENQKYESASLYKLWIMGETYHQMEQGKITPDQILSEDIPTLNSKFDIDPNSAELTEGTITFSINDALNQMITISHNYAALLLSEKIGLSNVSEYLKEHDLDESSTGEPPTTTASDVAFFLEQLYTGKLGNSQSTQSMLNLLKNQQLNGKLPKYLPSGTIVAHKTGEIDYYSHDAGIVYTDKGDYIIVILSQSDNPPAANERIAKISQAVYNYFQTTN